MEEACEQACVGLNQAPANGDLLQCEMGVYPFMFASVKDFQPVVDKLVEVRIGP